jgi:hypothetical protein
MSFKYLATLLLAFVSFNSFANDSDNERWMHVSESSSTFIYLDKKTLTDTSFWVKHLVKPEKIATAKKKSTMVHYSYNCEKRMLGEQSSVVTTLTGGTVSSEGKGGLYLVIPDSIGEDILDAACEAYSNR